MAASAASSVVGAMGAMGAAKTAKQTGEANAQLAERDALVAENNKVALEQKLFLDLERAADNFGELQTATQAAFIFRGVDATEGTPLDQQIANVREFAHDKQIAEYNTKIAKQEQTELAVFSRMKGDIARLQGNAAASQYKTQAFTSLLGGAKSVGMIGAQY